jgi:hypothetical protein
VGSRWNFVTFERASAVGRRAAAWNGSDRICSGVSLLPVLEMLADRNAGIVEMPPNFFLVRRPVGSDNREICKNCFTT